MSDEVCFHFGDDEITGFSGNRRASKFMNRLKRYLTSHYLEDVEFDYGEAKICMSKRALNNMMGKLTNEKNGIEHLLGRFEMVFDRDEDDIYL